MIDLTHKCLKVLHSTSCFIAFRA